MTIGIIAGDFYGRHSSSWTDEWAKTCKLEGLEFEILNWRQNDIMYRAMRHDVILWHFSHYSAMEMNFARSILYALSASGRVVFPKFNDGWHFDDKIAQSFLLQAIGAPIPCSHTFFSREDLDAWMLTSPVFPLVAKLRVGSGSNNVLLLKGPQELSRYADVMFAKGMISTPSPIFKIASNLGSVKSWHDILKRVSRIPDFIFSLSQANKLPRESGYVYVQEFIENASFDLKIVVIRDKMSFIGRRIRKGDFRASGGGDLFYDRSIVSKNVIDAAFNVADGFSSDCVGMDVVLSSYGSPLILEISYGFSHAALLNANGYFDRSGRWYNSPLNAPREILINCVDNYKRGL